MRNAVFLSVLLGLAVTLPVTSVAGSQYGADVQTAGNSLDAGAGDKGATVASSALIIVLVTDSSTKNIVANLGTSTGNGTAGISLPRGWGLTTIAKPAGGCTMKPTQFTNLGTGVYTIRVVPLPSDTNCAWRSGQYHYVVRISVSTSGYSPDLYYGSGLGVLTIQ